MNEDICGLGLINTVNSGQDYLSPLASAVWTKARQSAAMLGAIFTDDYGNEIRRACYGDRTSPWGWEIDHITPVALGGTDDLWNLSVCPGTY